MAIEVIYEFPNKITISGGGEVDTPKAWFVDFNQVENGTGKLGNYFNNRQSAIDASSNGDVVFVMAGTEPVTGDVTVNKDIIIKDFSNVKIPQVVLSKDFNDGDYRSLITSMVTVTFQNKTIVNTPLAQFEGIDFFGGIEMGIVGGNDVGASFIGSAVDSIESIDDSLNVDLYFDKSTGDTIYDASINTFNLTIRASNTGFSTNFCADFLGTIFPACFNCYFDGTTTSGAFNGCAGSVGFNQESYAFLNCTFDGAPFRNATCDIDLFCKGNIFEDDPWRDFLGVINSFIFQENTVFGASFRNSVCTNDAFEFFQVRNNFIESFGDSSDMGDFELAQFQDNLMIDFLFDYAGTQLGNISDEFSPMFMDNNRIFSFLYGITSTCHIDINNLYVEIFSAPAATLMNFTKLENIIFTGVDDMNVGTNNATIKNLSLNGSLRGNFGGRMTQSEIDSNSDINKALTLVDGADLFDCIVLNRDNTNPATLDSISSSGTVSIDGVKTDKAIAGSFTNDISTPDIRVDLNYR